MSLTKKGTIRVEGLCSMAEARRRLGKRRSEEEGNVSVPHRYCFKSPEVAVVGLTHLSQGFRETFSRPVRRIRFLGLFDTVNSVPHFENAWMKRAKFPYTARSTAKVIRHAGKYNLTHAKHR